MSVPTEVLENTFLADIHPTVHVTKPIFIASPQFCNVHRTIIPRDLHCIRGCSIPSPEFCNIKRAIIPWNFDRVAISGCRY
jgi:hypothetical protein